MLPVDCTIYRISANGSLLLLFCATLLVASTIRRCKQTTLNDQNAVAIDCKRRALTLALDRRAAMRRPGNLRKGDFPPEKHTRN